MLTNLLFEAMLLAAASMPLDARVRVHFQVVDTSGGAVSNAVATVATRRDRIENMGHGDSPMRRVAATTDADGRASVAFPCYSGEFLGEVSAEGFYPEGQRDFYFKCAKGSFFFARLLEREKTVRFTLRRKIHPIPLFCNETGHFLKMPCKSGRFGFDIKENDWLPPHGKGKAQDFLVAYRHETTREGQRFSGTILFAEGCGAYRMKKMPYSFCSVYRADTNAVYRRRFDFVRAVSPTNFIEKADVLGEDEYLVLRTRATLDAQGAVVSANYSKIYGAFTCVGVLFFGKSYFNPVPNDPNLEYSGTNLAPYRR